MKAAEAMDGTTLAQLLQGGEPIAAADALPILRRCAEVLDASPQHRQVTPARITLVGGSEIRIGGEDAALPAAADQGLPAPENAAYFSPEEVLGTPADLRSTEFSLGVIAYQMLTGRKPFSSPTLSGLIYEICAAAPAPADGQNASLNRPTAAVLQRALAKDPLQRFESCTAFVRGLQEAVSQPKGAEPTRRTEPVAAATAMGIAAAASVPEVPFADLPAARRRRAFDSEPVAPRAPAPSRFDRIGTFRMVLIGAVAACILVFLLDRHSTPKVQQQTIDPRVGPVAPPPPPEDTGEDENTNTSPPATKVKPQVASKAPKPVVPIPSRAPEKPASRVPVPQLSGAGSVAVELLTEPPGASVVVDGHSGKSCIAPCTVLLAAGRHVLSAQLQGYAVAQRIFNTPQTSSVIVALGPNLGTLIVSSFPEGATLSVDGRQAGRCPITLHLRAGQHRLEAVSGGQVRQQVVNVQADAIQGATFNLQ